MAAEILDLARGCESLVERLTEDVPTLVGIDHGFSFPLQLFRGASPKSDWPAFLDDFQHHLPTNTYVNFVRDGLRGNSAGIGNAQWRRLTEERAGSAKSSVHFSVQGSVTKSTRAGIPWLRFIRERSAPVSISGPSMGGTSRLGVRPSPRSIQPADVDLRASPRRQDKACGGTACCGRRHREASRPGVGWGFDFDAVTDADLEERCNWHHR
jgi:hypothetical protein